MARVEDFLSEPASAPAAGRNPSTEPTIQIKTSEVTPPNVTAVTSSLPPSMPFSVSQGGCMSAALVERIAETQELPSLVQVKVETPTQKSESDAHRLLPVFIFGAIALVGAFAVVGTIMALLALRGTGLNAPW
jgi:hypothetical protein